MDTTSQTPCGDLPVAGVGSGPDAVPTAVLGRGALPFTGIGDVFLPLAIAVLVLCAGVLSYRVTSVREALRAARRRALERAQVRPRTGYAEALNEVVSLQQSELMWREQRFGVA